METQTLFQKVAECWSFNLTWSLMQLGILLFLTTVFLCCSLSTRRGTGVGMAIVLSTCYLVINQVCWLAFLSFGGWHVSVPVFSFTFRPFAPAFSFYLGVLALTALVCNAIHILRQHREYSFRQLVSILIACVILIFAVAISARTPVVILEWLETEELRIEQQEKRRFQLQDSTSGQPMGTIQSARSFLDRQTDVAAWYTEYEGATETICYANGYFAEVFDIPVDRILEKKRYHLVNPPDTPGEVIERYKDEDREAMECGIFLTRGLFEPGKDIVVVKLRFDRGMLGVFKIVDSQPGDGGISVQDLDADFLDVLRQVRPGMLE